MDAGQWGTVRFDTLSYLQFAEGQHRDCRFADGGLCDRGNAKPTISDDRICQAMRPE